MKIKLPFSKDKKILSPEVPEKLFKSIEDVAMDDAEKKFKESLQNSIKESLFKQYDIAVGATTRGMLGIQSMTFYDEYKLVDAITKEIVEEYLDGKGK